MGERVFEAGIVLAGAISAGAYSAGVMDFLMEALDAYEDAKKQPNWKGPTHTVRIPVMAGASAGGMTAGMCARQAFHDMDHIWPGNPVPDKAANRLYSSWVTDISIESLLDTDDLERGREAEGVKSLLCSDVLDRIANDAFDMKGPPRERNWIGRENDRSLRVLLTLSNLRGIPYSFSIFGRNERYGMLNHGDCLDFKMGRQPTLDSDDTYTLDIDNQLDGNWDLFKTAVLATGAFPVGLLPRLIRRKTSDYRNSEIIGYEDADSKQFKVIPPDNSIYREPEYRFVSTDGGVINNEPLELARRYLAGGAGKINDPNGDKAKRAVVLIAPFPNFVNLPPYNSGETLLDIIPQLISTLIDQARFKPDELAKAANDKVFSRFMISPSRPDGATPEAIKYPIASGALGGFSGFLHEFFRRHDYLLGRRNAQAFLRWTFALPETNDLFDDFRDGRDEWYVRDTRGATGSIGPSEERAFEKKYFAQNTQAAEDKAGLPIIPLVGKLQNPIEIGEPDLPRPDNVNLTELNSQIRARASRVVDTLVDVDLYGLTENLIVGALFREGARHYGTEVASQKASLTVRHAIQDVARAFNVPLNFP